MTDKASIRPAVESDLEAVRTLYEHLNRSDPILPADQLLGAWMDLLRNHAVTCLVAQVQGEVVSTCTLVIVPNLSRSARPYAFIENVVTHEQHRRKGLGTAVLRAALELAWSRGCYKVSLITGSTREETLRFYERAGFKRGEKTAFVARPL
jgi:ribosomal protein S18 acetylase RimI-like enzyme